MGVPKEQTVKRELAKPPPPKTPPPVQNNSVAVSKTPEKTSDARNAAELSAEKQKLASNTSMQKQESSTATTAEKLVDDDFDPLNQTVGKPHNKQRQDGASELEKKKGNKQFSVDKTFEISIGDLDLLERIGEGGFSTVHKARSKSNRSIVAVKILKQQAPSEKTLESFAKEICLHSQDAQVHVRDVPERQDAKLR